MVNWRTEPRDPEVLFVIEAAANLPPGYRVVKVVPGVSGHDKLQLIARRWRPMTRLRSSSAWRRRPGRRGRRGRAVPSVAGQRAISVRRGIGDQDVEGDHGQHGRPGDADTERAQALNRSHTYQVSLTQLGMAPHCKTH